MPENFIEEDLKIDEPLSENDALKVKSISKKNKVKIL